MKALIWSDINEMQWADAAEPPMHEGWITVESLMVGVCGSEVSAFLGHNELRRPPLVMGHEFVARIVADVPTYHLMKGDLVTVNPLITCGQCRACVSGHRQRCPSRRIIGIDFPGAFGTRVAVPARQCYPVNDPVHGALTEPLACAVRAVNQAQVELGDAVLVLGAGIIGLMSAWVAKTRGAGRVMVVDPNAARLQHGQSWGATDVIDAGTENVSEAVRDRVPDGVDRVIDAVGFESTRATGLDTVRRGGRVVWIGLHENRSTLPGNQMVRDETEVVGSFCYTDEEFRQAVLLVNAGFVDRPGSWLDVRPIEAGHQAFLEQAQGPAPFAKIILQLG
ncbi:MAG: FAD-dependent oxidoreductase [Thermaerobacter sp.]|nr:FAD-dependent oxidoreductase [Thermaerobacter sp.]